MQKLVLPTSSLGLDDGKSMADECRYVIDQMIDYKKLENFNPDMYFKFMTHIHMKEGFRLDYVDYNNDMFGWPILYARKINDPQFASYEEFLASFGDVNEEDINSGTAHAYAYLEKVEIDGKPESYFELLLLKWLGDNFKLGGYAEDFDKKWVLCDASDLQYVSIHLKRYGDDCNLSPVILFNADNIDYTPTVAIGKDEYLVKFVSFQWNGIYEYIYAIDRDQPWNISARKSNQIIEYNLQDECGVIVG
jgi:hypothetical protein